MANAQIKTPPSKKTGGNFWICLPKTPLFMMDSTIQVLGMAQIKSMVCLNVKLIYLQLIAQTV
ncbi:hypothetical protein R6Q57_004147 [Mikania cordata]